MPNEERKKRFRAGWSQEVQRDVFIECRRRCALCFALRQDARWKKGQLAHIDRDRTNNAKENAAYLCLPHHDEYDSTSLQSRRLTAGELIEYQRMLIEYVKALIPPVGKNKIPANVKGRPFEGVSLEVYKERLPIYTKSVEFLREVAKDLQPDTQLCIRFARDTELALFLFDRTVADYLLLLMKEGLRLHSLYVSRTAYRPPENLSRMIKEETELALWFTEQYEVLRNRLAPFLSLADR